MKSSKVKMLVLEKKSCQEKVFLEKSSGNISRKNYGDQERTLNA